MRVIFTVIVALLLVSCNTPKRSVTTTHVVKKGFDVVPKKIREENRLALVIGNQNYQFFGKLNNPVLDAKKMSIALRQKGFEVISLANASQFEMQSAIEKFSYKLRNGGTGLFYYSGHGVEVGGENYLIPIDSRVPSRVNKSNSISLSSVILGMKDAKNRFNMVILDACRSRPDGKGGGGLAPLNSASGVFVAYATYPGGISEDGEKGGNGLYTKHLLQELNQPLNITDIFNNVGQAVKDESIDHQQRPWTSSSMYGKFYFTLPTKKPNNVVNPNIQKAKIAKLEKECALNNGASCYTLGLLYAGGSMVTKNMFKSLKLLSKACDLNNGEACSLLGLAYWGGKELPQDYQKAVKLYQKSCDLNNVDGCYNLAVGYNTGQGTMKDIPKSLKLFTKACNLNHARACYNLGAVYNNGIFVQKDYQKSIKFYQKSCNLNNGRGCFTLGLSYTQGYGIPKNFNLGMKYFEKSCELKYNKGCFMLGIAVERNHKNLAIEYYEKACNLGHKEACHKF
ncbi:hypothetical protein GSY74_07705 [Sulfurovum sp. bin170]|uniref:caspase family protein n=1 Tax=Sulfurovum sp. bin170 TaxID=2695268 RepID=UPI0013E09ACE|nr:caspase family protein [Sulfurovum sp. bin170]NEW61164.1 hypothetical protein [Sulfurovum sp. bin170]